MTAQQLNILQQNLQQLAMQKQQLEAQIVELDSALEELPSAQQSYKIVGKIMIAASPDALQKELHDKKEVAQVRLNNLLKQEERVQQKFERLQKEALQEMQKKH